MKKALLLGLISVFVISGVFAGQSAGEAAGEMKTYTIFLGYDDKPSYPPDGTIFGNWLEEQTNVKIEWDILVGDLDQKVGIIAASGDFPDAIHPRSRASRIYDAGGFIELDELIDEHGPNIKKLYEGRMDSFRYGDEKKVYWFPQVMPFGTESRKSNETHGIWIQKAVLKEYGYPMPANLEEAFDLLADYAKKYPEINGNKTLAFTGLYDGWRWFPVANAPSLYMGHPNDGGMNVDWIGDKWVVSYDGHYSNTVKEAYKLYNDLYLQGLYDTEAFVMDYDQYLAKLSTGSILAFHDQKWQFDRVQKIMRQQGEDRFWVCLPIAMEGFEEEYEGPLQPQQNEGIGISPTAKDPAGLMKYFDFLAQEKVILMKKWGFEGTDYMVDSNGVFYRTQEQIEKWRNQDFTIKEWGATYWNNFLMADGASLTSDGKNNFDPVNQPSVFQATLLDTEKEVLNAYGVSSWYEMFNPPDPRREAYFPHWTISRPSGSIEDITNQKLDDIRRKYIPLLIMADGGEYNAVWEEFMAEVEKVPQADRDKLLAFNQSKVDERVEAWGGYEKLKQLGR